MTCSEDQLVAFLAGDLSVDEAREFDDHLLSCEACWNAVRADRAVRTALSSLREPAPAGLSDRIALLTEMAPDRTFRRREDGRGLRSVLGDVDERPGTARRRRWLPAAIGAAAAVGLALGLVLAGGSSPPGMPAQVAAVAAIAEPMSSASSAPSERNFTVDGESMHVQFFVVDHLVVTVATEKTSFPMVAPSELESGSSSRSWLASIGDLGVFCMNHDRNGESMLVMAKMPAAELPAVAVRLHLI
jgi:Putative zinc-finger